MGCAFKGKGVGGRGQGIGGGGQGVGLHAVGHCRGIGLHADGSRCDPASLGPRRHGEFFGSGWLRHMRRPRKRHVHAACQTMFAGLIYAVVDNGEDALAGYATTDQRFLHRAQTPSHQPTVVLRGADVGGIALKCHHTRVLAQQPCHRVHLGCLAHQSVAVVGKEDAHCSIAHDTLGRDSCKAHTPQEGDEYHHEPLHSSPLWYFMRYSIGVMPRCSFTYLPKKEGVAKRRSWAICCIVISVKRRRCSIALRV